ncbi:hypothetical protein VQ643_00590 [Pseudomonas sp. F1_0610]|uniref:hypothetical protein n=1 Tax=Pseudomonas sp. F1_0610 TaxID=3114284 RepID=UPI0039C2BB4E
MLNIILEHLSSEAQLEALLSIQQELTDADFVQILLIAVNPDIDSQVRLEALKVLSRYSQPLHAIFFKNGLCHLIGNDSNDYIRIAALNALSLQNLSDQEFSTLLLALVTGENKEAQVAGFKRFREHFDTQRVHQALEHLAHLPQAVEQIKQALLVTHA